VNDEDGDCNGANKTSERSSKSGRKSGSEKDSDGSGHEYLGLRSPSTPLLRLNGNVMYGR
jgi:hypothetical protein